MSYVIVVEVKDGTPLVELSGPVPDGRYAVRGHIGEDHQDISAERITADMQRYIRSFETVNKEV